MAGVYAVCKAGLLINIVLANRYLDRCVWSDGPEKRHTGGTFKPLSPVWLLNEPFGARRWLLGRKLDDDPGCAGIGGAAR
ncbi:hypothetical protein EAS64_25675 [Trebonia kvetii]|uniref:Uncharacterized protein n=1 Tax=Trebonia kvetii TaxID=2480626 RepID=A0A6P2BTJ0_9ACTN|nr:hypothetical protein [Trebonia kvetii]TVZ02218.1 hypothetical protein EAS64_25675 [Trebonia kvetii]